MKKHLQFVGAFVVAATLMGSLSGKAAVRTSPEALCKSDNNGWTCPLVSDTVFPGSSISSAFVDFKIPPSNGSSGAAGAGNSSFPPTVNITFSICRKSFSYDGTSATLTCGPSPAQATYAAGSAYDVFVCANAACTGAMGGTIWDYYYMKVNTSFPVPLTGVGWQIP